MSDYIELKRLAEAASNHEWFADDWSDDFGDDKTTIGFRTQEVISAGNHGVWPEGIQWHRVASTEEGENPLADAAFIAAANPAAVLALIAELKVSTNVGRSLAETLESVCESRDALARAVGQLKAENDSMRKDAERYRWLRSTTCWEDSLGDSPLSIAWSSYGEDTGNSSGEDLDAAVDAAMIKGGQS